jgi:phosphoglucomutase
MYEDDVKKKTITGVVVQAKLGGTSKSAHKGFVLQTKKGDVKLRREGGNPFYDDYFEKYEAAEVTVSGFDMNEYFLVTSIKEIKQGKEKK